MDVGWAAGELATVAGAVGGPGRAGGGGGGGFVGGVLHGGGDEGGEAVFEDYFCGGAVVLY